MNSGDVVEVSIEKPASGGRMIARHHGAIILVAGAIPGERVQARIARAEKRVAFADAVEIIEPSAQRREPSGDPACGGCLYAHIAYSHQIELKALIIEDAFARIGRIPLAHRVAVRSASERAYRMRARFHVKEGRAGFYREGTHIVCDPRPGAQLLEESVAAVEAALTAMVAGGIAVHGVELSENIAASQRALHFDVTAHDKVGHALEAAVERGGVTGATARASDGSVAAAGDPIVTDPFEALTDGRLSGGTLQRHPESFFQGNRFLVGSLTAAVMEATAGGRILDLYAGVGLFSVALAAASLGTIVAVEGDTSSGGDLERNAAPFGDRLRVVRGSVEGFLRGRRRGFPDTLIVDPPRTGMTKEAVEGIARCGAKRLVYVSCDPPTMARDARRLLDGGYALASLEGFDLFPNTPHVESLGVFDLRSA